MTNLSKWICTIAVLCFGMMAFAQSSQIVFDPVESTIKQGADYRSADERTYTFVLQSGNYSFVRIKSLYSEKLKSMKVDFFEFGSTGKLILSKLDMFASVGNVANTITNVFHFRDRVYVLSATVVANKYNYTFWDITTGATVKTLEITSVPKSFSYESSGVVRTSPNQNYLMLATGGGSNLIVIDKNLEVVYNKQLIETANPALAKESILDNYTIDDNGYVSMSLFLKEQPIKGYYNNFKEKTGHWFMLTIDTKGDKIGSRNLAELWEVNEFSKGLTSAYVLNNGKVLYFAYSHPKKNDWFTTFDLVKDDVIAQVELGEKYGFYPETDFSIQDIYAAGDDILAYGTLSETGKQNAVMYLNRDGKLINKKILSPFYEINMVDYTKRSYAANEDLFVLHGCEPDDLKLFNKSDYSNELMVAKYGIKLKSEPMILHYQAESDKFSYIKCPINEKVKPSNREYFLTQEGLVVIAEYSGKSITWRVHKLS
jgi:hypothetical protein